MREEHIDYPYDLPINIDIVQIESYPLHWHNAIQIFLVLEGKLEIEIGLDKYQIEAGEVEIVNPNEVHSLNTITDKNLLMVFTIDPSFFQEYYHGAKDMFYYADSSKREIQQSAKYDQLRESLAVLFYEVLAKHKNYKSEVHQQLLSLMFYLLNNFHYLYYEGENLEDDDLELERYHRIVSYITNNYMEKVSLQEIADREFLTSQYLSYKIKATFGHGFNDYLNLTRVEESVKLLLNTDMNITEISQEVGFSHVRYYNKHFKAHYKLTPLQYRKKYKVTDDQLEAMIKVEFFPLETALPFVESYLEGYHRYKYDDHIYKFEISLETQPIGKVSTCKIVNLGSADRLIYHDNLEQLIADLNFEKAVIENIKSILPKFEGDNTDWSLWERLTDSILALGVSPIFITDQVEEYLPAFINHLTDYRRDIDTTKIEFTSSKDFYKNKIPLFERENPKNDTLHAVGSIIEKNLALNERVPRLFDKPVDNIGDSDTFNGGTGLITANGLLKPAYYIYRFLTLMGDELLYKEEGIVVTKGHGGFQVLLYDPRLQLECYHGQRRRYSLVFTGMNQNYQIVRHELNKDSGSVYDKWGYLQKPKRLSPENITLFEKSIQPEIKFYYGEKSNIFNIYTIVKDKGAHLYLFLPE